MNLQAETYETALKRGMFSTRTWNLRPGVYQLRMLVREEGSNLIGTANSYVEIPDLKSDQLVVSNIHADASLAVKTPQASESKMLSKRHFKQGSLFAYSLVIYNARKDGKTNQPQMEMRARVLKEGQVVFSDQPRPVQMIEGSKPPSRIVTGGILQLGQLAPGDYTL